MSKKETAVMPDGRRFEIHAVPYGFGKVRVVPMSGKKTNVVEYENRDQAIQALREKGGKLE